MRHLEVSETITLPIGLEHNGEMYRTVVIDEMTGVDEENLANPRFKGDPGKALTMLLQRCVQAIPGVVERKPDPYKYVDAEIFKKMYSVDRDAIVIGIRMLTYGSHITLDWDCDYCSTGNEDSIDLTTLNVQDWDGEDRHVSFELPRGVPHEGKVLKKGKLRFPTGADAERISKQAKTDPGGASTQLLAAIMVDLEGIRPDRVMVQRMRSKDRQYIAALMNDNAPGVKIDVDLACAACGRMNMSKRIDPAAFFSNTSAA